MPYPGLVGIVLFDRGGVASKAPHLGRCVDHFLEFKDVLMPALVV